MTDESGTVLNIHSYGTDGKESQGPSLVTPSPAQAMKFMGRPAAIETEECHRQMGNSEIQLEEKLIRARTESHRRQGRYRPRRRRNPPMICLATKRSDFTAKYGALYCRALVATLFLMGLVGTGVGSCRADRRPDPLRVTIIVSDLGQRLDEPDRAGPRDGTRSFVEALDAMSAGGRILITSPGTKEEFRCSLTKQIVGELQEGTVRRFHVRLMHRASPSERVSSQELFTHAVRELHQALGEVVACLIHKDYLVRSLAVVGGHGAVLFGKALENHAPVFDHVLVVDSLGTVGRAVETVRNIGESKTTILVQQERIPSALASLFSSLFGGSSGALDRPLTSPSAAVRLKAIVPGTTVRMIRQISSPDTGCRNSQANGRNPEKARLDAGNHTPETGCWEARDAIKRGTNCSWSETVRIQSTQQLIESALGLISSEKKLSQPSSACRMIQDFFFAASHVRELQRIGFYGQEFSNELEAANCPDGCFPSDYQAIVMRSIIGWVDEMIDYCACPRGSQCRQDCRKRCLDYVESLKTVCPNLQPPPIVCRGERQSPE